MGKLQRWLGLSMLVIVVVGVIGAVPQGVPPRGASQAPAGSLNISRQTAAANPNTFAITDTIRFDPVLPITVNLVDLPPATAFDTWEHQGNLGPNEADILPLEQWAQQEAQALNLPPSDKVIQVWDAAAPSSEPLLGFDTLDYSQCCGPSGGLTPPDPVLAVGTNHVMVAVNKAFAIYDKNGASLLGPITLSALFAGTGSGCGTAPFDPELLYDEKDNRYLLIADGGGTALCVAVSQTGNPTSGWYVYTFNTGTGFFDFPQAGIGRNELFVGANNYGAPGGVGQIYAIRKADLYAGVGAAAIMRTINPSLTNPSPTPAHLHGFDQGTWPTSGPHHILVHHYDDDVYTLYAWDAPFGANNLTSVAVFDLTATTGIPAGTPLIMPQKNGADIGGRPNQGRIDSRQWDLEYRNGFLWTTMHISCNPGYGSVNCIRWAKIEPNSGSIVQYGVLGSNGTYRAYPDLMVDRFGNMAMVYARMSSDSYPGAFFTCRSGTIYPAQVWLEGVVKGGEVAYTSFPSDVPPYRWGDYMTMTIDPDGETFWAIGEYSKDIPNEAHWGTYVVAFTYEQCPMITDELYLPLLNR
ncbi:MAG: hypothetical protein KA314_16085 [Chloroflexi bacterium]|nr:hypothetical protein [Chloroflexota bacterium]MBP8057355.1 hypothetical protein [Chloroflexota bacterium]